jgi:hypothetical protein
MNDDEFDPIDTETDETDESEALPGWHALSGVALRHMTMLDWARFGTQEIAYIRPVMVDGAPAVAIHAADGTPIGAAPNEALAAMAIRQHEMEPQLVH